MGRLSTSRAKAFFEVAASQFPQLSRLRLKPRSRALGRKKRRSSGAFVTEQGQESRRDDDVPAEVPAGRHRSIHMGAGPEPVPGKRSAVLSG